MISYDYKIVMTYMTYFSLNSFGSLSIIFVNKLKFVRVKTIEIFKKGLSKDQKTWHRQNLHKQ